MALPQDPQENAAVFAPDAMPEVQKPQLVQRAGEVGSRYIKRYTRYFRKLDRAMQRLCGDLQIVDDQMVPHPVPLVLGTVEAAVAAMFGETSTFGSNSTGQMRAVVLPMACLVPGDPSIEMDRNMFHAARTWSAPVTEKREGDTRLGFAKGVPVARDYQLVLWTRYMEEMLELLELVILKLHPEAEFWLPDDFAPTTVQADGFATNFQDQREQGMLRIYKVQVGMTVHGWLPQPVERRRTVLDVQIATEVGLANPTQRAGTVMLHAEDVDPARVAAQKGPLL